MRAVALSCFATVLAACGGTGGDVTLPTSAPEGAQSIVQELFEICGTALNGGDVIKALPVAGKLGWELDDEFGGGIGAIDIMRSTMIRKPDIDHMIQFSEHDGPHSKFMSCQLIGSFGDDAVEINPADFENMEGFEGRWEAVKTGAMTGYWSKRSGSSVASIFTTATNGSFSMIAMNKSTLK